MQRGPIAIYNKNKLSLETKVLETMKWKEGHSIKITYDDKEDCIYMEHMPNVFVIKENGLIPIT